MDRFVSLETFRPFPTVLTDARGGIAFCNSRAKAILGRRARRLAGRRCWEVMKLVDSRGVPLCCSKCPVQCHVRSEPVPFRDQVTIRSDGESLDLDLLAFAVPARSQGRVPILHFLMPRTNGSASVRTDRLGRLTPREVEILGLLAAGFGTSAIAFRLCVSPNTVRNHVQHMLNKLGVHDRLQAVLVFLKTCAAR